MEKERKGRVGEDPSGDVEQSWEGWQACKARLPLVIPKRAHRVIANQNTLSWAASELQRGGALGITVVAEASYFSHACYNLSQPVRPTLRCPPCPPLPSSFLPTHPVTRLPLTVCFIHF